MLRVASNAVIVPPFECAWLSLRDYQLGGAGGFCLQFECKGENDVTIILKPFPGAKRWQHLQRLQGPAGGEQLAVEANYTVILGSHRNSKLKIEKNGDEQGVATGLPGCTVTPAAFTACWINYNNGCISVGTGPVGSSLSYSWQDPEPAIQDIQHVGLSCWDKHVSYRNVQLLPALPPALLRDLQAELQVRQLQAQAHEGLCYPDTTAAGAGAHAGSNVEGHSSDAAVGPQQHLQLQLVPPLLQLVQAAIIAQLQPCDVCHMLQLSEALLPRTQHLYERAVQLAGEWLGVLVQQHLQELAMLPLDVLVDVLHEPLLDVQELAVFQAVAAWCEAALGLEQPQQADAEAAEGVQQQQRQLQQQGLGVACGSVPAEVTEVLQLVRFALMNEQERQAVLQHPFTKACGRVQQCMEEDLQRLHDFHSGKPPLATEPGVRCQQRHLMLPAAHSCSSTDLPDASDLAAANATLVEAAPQQGTLQGAGAGAGAAVSGGRWRSYRRRLAPSCKELMYVCDGDRNGVIHYIATEYGTKPWVNPVLSKALDIKASSPTSRHTDPKAIVSGQFLNTSFAGPRYVRPPLAHAAVSSTAVTAAAASSSHGNGSSRAVPSTWWQLDLGPQHRLLCNYYVIRHDGSQEGYARSWALQGSPDLQHWLDLRCHTADSTIRLPGQYGSWPVTGPAACMPFRAFRLVLTGPTQSQTNPWAFCLSYWELYGFFYKLRNAGSDTKAAAT